MAEWASVIVSAVSAFALIMTLYALVRSNRRLSASLRIGTLQQMVSEMNVLRNRRADHPAVERGIFAERANWTDDEIRENLLAVELANIFEWAYIARREGFLDSDVWESWAETWRSVILASPPLRNRFTETVWTFARSPAMLTEIMQFIDNPGDLSDPRQRRVSSWWKQRLDLLFRDEPL